MIQRYCMSVLDGEVFSDEDSTGYYVRFDDAEKDKAEAIANQKANIVSLLEGMIEKDLWDRYTLRRAIYKITAKE